MSKIQSCMLARVTSPIAVLCWTLLLFADLAQAVSISSIGPFTGTLTETWESRNNYLTPTFHTEPNPTTIMSGAATLSYSTMGIYEPNPPANFVIGSVNAHVSDGTKGMGLSNSGETAILSFAGTVSDFGAYWGSGTPSNGATVGFFAVGGVPIDTAVTFSYTRNTTDGVLEWHGWHSTTPIKSVRILGDFVVMDGLQASVPEPANVAMLFPWLLIAALRPRSNAAQRCGRITLRAAPTAAR